MQPATRAAAAILFTGSLATVLALPLINSSTDSSGDRGGRTVAETSPAESPTTSSPTPAPEDTPEETPTATDEVKVSPVELGQPYPAGCLRPAVPAPSPGSVAVAGPDGLQIAPVGEGASTATSAPVDPPIAWNSSGTLLATGDGALYGGAEPGSLDTQPLEAWAWSPTSDCAIGVRGGKVLALDPGRPAVRIGYANAEALAFSPDGTRLGLLVDGRDPRVPTVWVIDLAEGGPPRYQEPDPAWLTVSLAGWTGDSEVLLYWATSSESPAEGAPLLGFEPGADEVAVYTGPSTEDSEVMLPDPGFVETCGGKLIGVVGTGTDDSPLHLALLRPGRAPEPLGSGYVRTYPSCDPGGSFIATIQARSGESSDERRLALLDTDGSVVDVLTTDTGYADEYATWGGPNTGVLFARRPLDGDTAEVWYIAEGETARSLGLEVAPPSDGPGWGSVIDWSADTPTGMSLPGPEDSE